MQKIKIKKMETLPMSKRYRSYATSDYQQPQQIQQSIQKLKENNTLNNKKPLLSHTNRLATSRPSTSSIVYNTNTNRPSLKSSGLLKSPKSSAETNGNISNTKTNLPSVNIVNFSNNIMDNSAKNSNPNFNQYSNQSSPLNSDIFVDRLSDQRIFNRQFKIPQNADNSPKSRSGSANQTQPSTNSNGHLKLKQQIYNQYSKTITAKLSRDEVISSTNYNTSNNHGNPSSRRLNNSNLSMHSKYSNNENNYQSSSMFFDYNLRLRKSNNNSATTNYLNNNYNQNRDRSPMSAADDSSKTTFKLIKNNGLNFRSSKYPGFGLNSQPKLIQSNLTPTTKSSKLNSSPTNISYFNDTKNVIFNKSSDSFFNENYYSTPTGNKVAEPLANADHTDYRFKSLNKSNGNGSPVPAKSAAIVNMMINNQNKLSEASRNSYKINNDLKKYQLNRVPVKFSRELLKMVKKENAERNMKISLNESSNNRINEEDEDRVLVERNEDCSSEEVVDNIKNDKNDELDADESALIEGINRKCDEWLDRHVLPFLSSISNTSSPLFDDMES